MKPFIEKKTEQKIVFLKKGTELYFKGFTPLKNNKFKLNVTPEIEEAFSLWAMHRDVALTYMDRYQDKLDPSQFVPTLATKEIISETSYHFEEIQ